jgi:outer membrane protein TolC
VDVNSPTVALARQRVEEAYLFERNAELAWLPDLEAGPTYNRHDGRDQNSNGTIFEVSKQKLFVGGGAVLDWNTSEIIFGRLAAERLTAAAQANARAVNSDVQLNVALAYFDLLQVYGEYAIFTGALARAEEMLHNAEAADQAGLSKSTADINRARTEVDLRRQRQIELQAQAAIASGRLARLLLLQPTVILRPIDPQIMPVGMVPDLSQLDDLIAIGLSNRPEVQQNRALIAAAMTRWKQAQLSPLIPHLDFEYRGGTFGGGPNDVMDDFGARSDGTAEATWQLRNFGAGDILQTRIRRTQVNEANLNLVDVQAQIAEEIQSAVRSAEAARRSMEFAQAAVLQATETWRRLREASFGLAGAEHQYDPLQPLIALRDLADAQRQYLQTVLDYNRAQFRLYWAMGQPPMAALPKLPPQPIQTPVVPAPYSPKPEEVPAPRKNPS